MTYAPSIIASPYTGATNALEEREINSMWGQLYVDGIYQQDVISFSGSVQIGKMVVAVAGSNKNVNRVQRITRSGTLRYRKSDSRFEDLLLTYANLGQDGLRAARAAGYDAFPQVQLLLVLDDPDSWGAEVIQLNVCQFWELPIGFDSTATDIITRDLPTTWEDEQLVLAVPRPGNQQGATDDQQAQYGFAGGTGYQDVGSATTVTVEPF